MIRRDLSLAEYHCRDAVSASRLADFARAPKLYFEKWIGKSIADFEAQDTTDAKQFGQAFEDLLFTPESFLSKWAIRPGAGKAADGRTVEGKAFAAANAGKPILTEKEHRKAEHMVSAIAEHDTAMAMIRECEQQVTLDCRIHGSLLQSRPDLINLKGSALSEFRPYTADLKSTEKLERILSGRAIVEYGYHRQAEIAAICMHENGIGSHLTHYLIVVEKTLPHRVAVLEFDPDFLSRARTWIFKNLAGIEQCAHAQHWPRSTPGIQTIKAPTWLQDDAEEEAA